VTGLSAPVRVGLAFIAVALCALSMVPAAVVAATSGGARAPLSAGLPLLASPASHSLGGSIAPSRAASAGAPSPSGFHTMTLSDLATSCAGPPPTWSGSNFFCDAVVSFSVRGQAAPADIPVVPQEGQVSEWAPGFYLNVSTNVPLASALVSIWAVSWPAPGQQAAPVSGFTPVDWNTSADQFPMKICSQAHSGCPTASADQASYYFDDDTYFFPGTQVSFDVELTTASGASPGQIFSQATESVDEPFAQLGVNATPTWVVNVLGPFASQNFSNDIQLSTDPSITGTPQNSPNPDQTVQVYLKAYNISGGPATPIPAADLNGFIIQGRGAASVTTTLTQTFGPANSTNMKLTVPIQPEASGVEIQFNVTAWQWGEQNDSRIDEVTSREYYFNYSAAGLSFPDPTGSVEANMNLTAIPELPGPPTSVLTSVPMHLPTGTLVNVSVHEQRQNVTLGPSEVDFSFDDHGATKTGYLVMTAVNDNTSYVVLPGLPPNASMTFQVVAKDANGNPVGSSNYTYFENGTPVPAALAGKGFFFLEVFDVSTGSLVSGLNYTVSNDTWFQSAATLPMGFGALLSYTTNSYEELFDGSYVLALSVFGQSIERTVTVGSTMPTTIIFYVASAPIVLATSEPPPIAGEVAGVVGLAAGMVVYFPLMGWFRERRAQAEAEQRRVTL
jgi:hypothetical protein